MIAAIGGSFLCPFEPTRVQLVDVLERELGIIVFECVDRGLTLAPSGLELLEHVRDMGHAAGRLSLAALGQLQATTGSEPAGPMPRCYAADHRQAAVAGTRRSGRNSRN